MIEKEVRVPQDIVQDLHRPSFLRIYSSKSPPSTSSRTRSVKKGWNDGGYRWWKTTHWCRGCLERILRQVHIYWGVLASPWRRFLEQKYCSLYGRDLRYFERSYFLESFSPHTICQWRETLPYGLWQRIPYPTRCWGHNVHRGLPSADHLLYDDTQSLDAGMRWIYIVRVYIHTIIFEAIILRLWNRCTERNLVTLTDNACVPSTNFFAINLEYSEVEKESLFKTKSRNSQMCRYWISQERQPLN